TIIVTLPEGEYSGNVTIYVDGTPYNRTITYDPATNISQAILTLDGLASGNYNVKAVFITEDGGVPVVYEGSTSFAVSKISSSIVINPISDINVGENATITFVVSPSDATGNITVYINGVQYIRYLDDMTLVVSDLDAGLILVHVYYNGDDKYLGSEDNTTFTVYKNEVIPQLSVSDITIDEIEEITVTLPEDATGYVLINVNGTQYYADISGGIAKYSIAPAMTGKYDVTVTYIGDRKYYSNETSGSYVVSKLKTNIEIAGENIIVGQDEVLTIITSVDLTEVIFIEIDGVNYTSFITNGKGNFTAVGLSEGLHNVTVYFKGDDKYMNASNKTSFTVKAKTPSALSINVTNITVGENEVIYVNVTPGATGNVTVVIRGREYTEKLDNGVATFTISDLTAREYEVTAIYNGDEYYLSSNNTAKFTVEKRDLDIIVTAQNITVGEDEIIEISLSESEDGTVLVNVGSTGYYVNVTGGKGSLTVSGLVAGDYDVTATYLGDELYGTKSNTTSFNVKAKADADMNVDIGDDNVTVELPGD
ncbi:Ig-like domain (group 3), partial [Methanobrevibacter millerae]